MRGRPCYHSRMIIPTNDGDNFPCQCHLSQYAYTDDLCPECLERAEARAELDADLDADNANPDEEPELLDTPGEEGAWEAEPDPEADADREAFGNACRFMTQEDWDADNDWLASAGWGEM